ncbi:MAG: hypothetical protein ACUVRD_02600 [Bacteroidia bacterium]
MLRFFQWIRLLWWLGAVGYYGLMLFMIHKIEIHNSYLADPSLYLAAARALVERGDFWLPSESLSFELKWFSDWPVGFSVLIAFIHWLSGLDLFYAAKILVYISILATTYVVYRYWGGKNRPWLLVGLWPPFFWYLLWAPFSEQVYAFMLLITTLCTGWYLRKGKGLGLLFLGGVGSFLIRYVGIGWVGVWLVLGLWDKRARKGLWLASMGLSVLAMVYWAWNYFHKGLFTPMEKYVMEFDWRVFWQTSFFVPRSAIWWAFWGLVAVYFRRRWIFRDRMSWVFFLAMLGHIGVFLSGVLLGRFGQVEIRQSFPVILLLVLWVGRHLPWRWAAGVYMVMGVSLVKMLRDHNSYSLVSYEAFCREVENTYGRLDRGSIVVGQYVPAFWKGPYGVALVDPMQDPETWRRWQEISFSGPVYVEGVALAPEDVVFLGLGRIDSCKFLGLVPCLRRVGARGGGAAGAAPNPTPLKTRNPFFSPAPNVWSKRSSSKKAISAKR